MGSNSLMTGCGGISMGFRPVIIYLDGERSIYDYFIEDINKRKHMELLKKVDFKYKRKEIISIQQAMSSRVKTKALRLLQLSQRQPQSDIKSTGAAAMIPVPPMINMKGGQYCVQRLGA